MELLELAEDSKGYYNLVLNLHLKTPFDYEKMAHLLSDELFLSLSKNNVPVTSRTLVMLKILAKKGSAGLSEFPKMHTPLKVAFKDCLFH